MTTLVLEPATGLQLSLSRSGHRITAILSVRGICSSVTSCDASEAAATTAGLPMLRLGNTSYSLPYARLCEAANALCLTVDGGRA